MDVDTEGAFVADEIKTSVKETVDSVLHDAVYDHDKVSQWTNQIVEDCTKKLVGLQKPFKYIVTCVIMQRTGAGIHTAASCFWDSSSDGYAVVRVDTKSMYAIATVFGVAL